MELKNTKLKVKEPKIRHQIEKANGRAFTTAGVLSEGNKTLQKRMPEALSLSLSAY